MGHMTVDVFAATFDACPDGVVVVDDSDVVVEWNSTGRGDVRHTQGRSTGRASRRPGHARPRAAPLTPPHSTPSAPSRDPTTLVRKLAMPARRADGSTELGRAHRHAMPAAPRRRRPTRSAHPSAVQTLLAAWFHEVESSADGRRIKSESESRLGRAARERVRHHHRARSRRRMDLVQRRRTQGARLGTEPRPRTAASSRWCIPTTSSRPSPRSPKSSPGHARATSRSTCG